MDDEQAACILNEFTALRLIESIASDLGIVLMPEKLSRDEWAKVAMALAIEWVKQKQELSIERDVTLQVANHYISKNEVKKQNDKQRVSSRIDQVDKRAFQEAVTANIDDYHTKADAIRDLQKQYSKYPEKTLRGWIKDVWNKPIKPGRPHK